MNTIPSEQVRRLGVHFSFSELKILPDNVFLGFIQKGGRKKRKPGEIIFRARNAQVSPFLVGLITNNLKSVFCDAECVQTPGDKEKDFYRAHFVYVTEDDRDEFQAMKHDAESSVLALEDLAKHTWDIVVWQNDVGRFDISCTQPRMKRPDSMLIFDQESLRCTG